MFIQKLSSAASSDSDVSLVKRIIYYSNGYTNPWYRHRWYLLFILLVPLAFIIIFALRRRRFRQRPVVTQQPFPNQQPSGGYPQTTQTGSAYYSQQGQGYGNTGSSYGAYVPPPQPEQSYGGGSYEQAGYGPSRVANDEAQEVTGSYSRPEGPPPGYKS
ncbi:uncharacterized protein RJT21DRAFT_5373 [Scheffersomyces amazonensis]|uniref:uncharacterized protein n=1 Tax=Scheffersomyces amazonensis TaxID=1078765 RepID=UPI00315CAEDB